MTMHFCITGGAIQNVKLTLLLTQEEVVTVRQELFTCAAFTIQGANKPNQWAA
jgi:hypothetical protein